jgi:hypothetical protein
MACDSALLRTERMEMVRSYKDAIRPTRASGRSPKDSMPYYP